MKARPELRYDGFKGVFFRGEKWCPFSEIPNSSLTRIDSMALNTFADALLREEYLAFAKLIFHG